VGCNGFNVVLFNVGTSAYCLGLKTAVLGGDAVIHNWVGRVNCSQTKLHCHLPRQYEIVLHSKASASHITYHKFVGIGLVFSSQFALEVGVFNDDILEFYNACISVKLIKLRALKIPRFPPLYSCCQPPEFWYHQHLLIAEIAVTQTNRKRVTIQQN
jgi:hypothetical protein